MAVFDDFNRADSATISDATHPWVERLDTGASISNNTLVLTTGAATPWIGVWDASLGGSDMFAEGTIAGTYAGGFIGLVLRYDAVGDNGFSIEMADGLLKNVRVTAGSPDTDPDFGPSWTPAVGQFWHAQIEGASTATRIRLYIDGVLRYTWNTPKSGLSGTFSDTNVRAGLHLNSENNDTTQAWDNFRAGLLSELAGAPLPRPGVNLARPRGFIKPWLGSPGAEVAGGAVTLDGTAEVVVDASANMRANWALDSTTANVIVHATDATLRLALPLASSTANVVVQEASATLSVARPLASTTANAIVALTGELTLQGSVTLDGTANMIVGVGTTEIDIGGSEQLEGSVGMVLDVDDSNFRWRPEPHGGGPSRGSGPKYTVRAGWG